MGKLKITFSPSEYYPCPGAYCKECQFLGHGDPSLPSDDLPGQRKHWRRLRIAEQFSIFLHCETEETLILRNILPRLITVSNAVSRVPGEEQANQGRKRDRPEETLGTVKEERTTNIASSSGGRGGLGSSDIIDLTEDDGSDDMIIWKVIKCPKREVVSL